jgi:hypothetical protein
MTAILPYQGHGFGYRYLHAQMGDAALLGAYGWQRLGPWRDRLRGGWWWPRWAARWCCCRCNCALPIISTVPMPKSARRLMPRPPITC